MNNTFINKSIIQTGFVVFAPKRARILALPKPPQFPKLYEKGMVIKMKIFTIGHSDLDLEEFIKILKEFKITQLVDVRSIPGSRYVPQYNQETLSKEIERENIEYIHMPSLGGRRKAPTDKDVSLVMGWKNSSFRNYAAYTLTPEYREGISELLDDDKTKCLMCAEAVPWRCHRLLVSNTLVTKGVEVNHIMNEEKSIKHKLNLYGAYAEIKDGNVIYPPEIGLL